MASDPSGKFVHVADSDFNEFSIFKLNQSTRVPTFVGTTGITQGGTCVPYTVNVDPSGGFIYNLGFTKSGCMPSTNAAHGFSINEGNGSLINVHGSPFANSNVHATITSEGKVLVTR